MRVWAGRVLMTSHVGTSDMAAPGRLAPRPAWTRTYVEPVTALQRMCVGSTARGNGEEWT